LTGSGEIPAELIQAGSEILLSEMHKLINSICLGSIQVVVSPHIGTYSYAHKFTEYFFKHSKNFRNKQNDVFRLPELIYP
jgi:hypothetical protein